MSHSSKHLFGSSRAQSDARSAMIVAAVCAYALTAAACSKDGNDALTAADGGDSASDAGGGKAPGTGGPTPLEGGAPPRVVGACEKLGKVDEFENVTPPGEMLGVYSIGVDPVNSGTVYLGTGSENGAKPQGMFKSTDCGSTWVKVSRGVNGDLFDTGTTYGITVDWFNPNVIYSAALYGKNVSLLRSANAGVDWTIMFPVGGNVHKAVPSVFTQEISMDEKDHQHLVVSFHDVCEGEYAPMCLGQTFNGGADWQLFKGPLKGWGENARPYVIDAKQVLFIQYSDVYYTADSTAVPPVWEKVAPYGGHVHHAANGKYYLASYQGTYRSDNGRQWTLIEGSPRGYAIAGDDKRIFTAGDVEDNFHFAYLTDDTVWMPLKAPPSPDKFITFAYDPGHHLLYTANHSGGVLRMVTQ